MPHFVLIIFLLFSSQISGLSMTGADINHSYHRPHSSHLNAKYSDSKPATENIGTIKNVTVTFYCSCEECCGNWSGLNQTASQTVPVAGQTLAGDEKMLGKKVIFTKVPDGMEYLLYHPDGSQKVFIVEDTGNPEYISGNRYDIYMGGPEMHDLCVELGVQKMQIRILK